MKVLFDFWKKSIKLVYLIFHFDNFINFRNTKILSKLIYREFLAYTGFV